MRQLSVLAVFVIIPLLNPESVTVPLPASPRSVYFVDAVDGNDGADGKRPESAWRTLSRASEAPTGPGTVIILKGDQRHRGTLRLNERHCGTKRQPVVITSASGRAVIEAGTGDGIRIEGSAHVRITGVDVVGAGRKNGSDGAGIRLAKTRNVEIRDVNVRGFRLGGILTGGDSHTRLIRIVATDNGFAGIAVSGELDGLPRSRDVYIGHCRAENNPGDPKNTDNHSGNGIVVSGADGALVECCTATNNGWDMPRDGNGPVGIWAWNADRVIIQRCLSYRNKSPGWDGGGFDFDGGVTNSIMQQNLSYENMGCGYLFCQYGGAKPWRNNIIRHNISFNDGTKNFQSGIGLWLGDKGISNAVIHDNTLVNLRHAVATQGDLPDFVYRRNLLIAGTDVLTGDFRASRFEDNLYWSPEGAVYRNGVTSFLTLDGWTSFAGQSLAGIAVGGLFLNPRIRIPDSGDQLPKRAEDLDSMKYFRFTSASPAEARKYGANFRIGLRSKVN